MWNNISVILVLSGFLNHVYLLFFVFFLHLFSRKDLNEQVLQTIKYSLIKRFNKGSIHQIKECFAMKRLDTKFVENQTFYFDLPATKGESYGAVFRRSAVILFQITLFGGTLFVI